jgi:cytoskeletal protein RodZ
MLCSITSRRRRHCVRSAVIRRDSLWAILVFLFLIQLTACVGPHVRQAPPSPPQESVVEQNQRVDVATQEEPPSAGTSLPPVAAPLPVAPLEVDQFEAPQESGESPVIETKPVLVTAQRESYTVDAAFTATKTDTPLMETPMAVQVVPKQVLQDQRVNRLQDALQNERGALQQQ